MLKFKKQSLSTFDEPILCNGRSHKRGQYVKLSVLDLFYTHNSPCVGHRKLISGRKNRQVTFLSSAQFWLTKMQPFVRLVNLKWDFRRLVSQDEIIGGDLDDYYVHNYVGPVFTQEKNFYIWGDLYFSSCLVKTKFTLFLCRLNMIFFQDAF